MDNQHCFAAALAAEVKYRTHFMQPQPPILTAAGIFDSGKPCQIFVSTFPARCWNLHNFTPSKITTKCTRMRHNPVSHAVTAWPPGAFWRYPSKTPIQHTPRPQIAIAYITGIQIDSQLKHRRMSAK